MTDSHQRLDQLVTSRGLAASRSRARDAIERGTVTVDGVVVSKPSAMVSETAEIAIADPAGRYVSRAALKLIAALDHFGLSPEGQICLDIGASTGGFCQVLLERGATHVTGVDVGHGQMHPAIAGDPRMTSLEGLNARELTRDDLPEGEITLVTSDVSFISLRLALPPALAIAEPGAHCILLVKPQFEAGREAVAKSGLLKDPTTAPDVARSLEHWLVETMGWESLGLIPSPIAGGDGNAEYLLCGRKPLERTAS